MKYLFTFLGIICLFTTCQMKQQTNDYVLLTVDGEEYKFPVTYAEMIHELPLCNLAFFSEKDETKRDLEIYMSLSMHGDGNYKSVDLTEDLDDLTEWTENEKILIFVLSVENKDSRIDGSYYVVDQYFHIKQTPGSYQVTTPAPIHLIDESDQNRQVTMELNISNVSIKDITL